ncbi:MAG: HEAT repeat domain-containing protein [Planctomycetes bacterium]|nr:HEAT repeat domain-containing protein [Planctomycetota bacterium]
MSTPFDAFVRALLLAGLAALLLVPEGLGHGGGGGGGGTASCGWAINKVPGPPQDPQTPTPDPGTTTGGGSKPKPKAPETRSGRGPTTPPAGPATGGPKTVTSGAGAKKRRAETGATWLEWWHANRDVFFAQLFASDDAITGREGMLNGVGRTDDGGADAAALFEAQSKILFGLRGVLDDAESEVVDSAVIAIARSVDPRFAAPLAKDLASALRSDVRTVRQSAILAFGMLATDDAATTLRTVLEGGGPARALCGGHDVDDVDRGFAAMSLGLLSDRTSVPAFVEQLTAIAGSRNIGRELAAGLVLGAGAFTTDREAMAISLGGLMDDPKVPREIRALVPVSLARLGEAASPFVPRLLMITGERDLDLELRQSALIALGRMCSNADREVVAALRATAANATDADLRHAALIALGEITARRTAEAEEIDAAVIETFERAIERPKSRSDVAWAALGAGQCVRARSATSPEHIALTTRLLTLLEETSDPETKGVVALSLGLARATNATDALSALATTSDVGMLRACAAEGLALIGDPAAADVVRDQLAREFDDAASASQALALGVLGDRRATKLLIERIGGHQSARTLVASALALGRLRDPAAVDPLLELARDESRPAVARGFAAIALGLIGERSPVRWNSRFCVGTNPGLDFDVQSEVMDIL